MRDISGVMDGGVNTSEAMSDIPLCTVDLRQDMAAVCSQEEVEIASYQGKWTSGLVHVLPGKPDRGAHLNASLIRMRNII